MAKQEEKTPQEASNIFHSIMKASVTPQNKKNNIKNMAQKYEHKGHVYWVTIDNAIHPKTNEGVYIAFVSDYEPGGFIGEQVRYPNGEPMFFTDRNAALTNANAVKQSQIDSRP